MVINKSELADLRQDLHGQTVALRLGCYDVLHAGHQETIDRDAQLADVLCIGVMPDIYVTRAKGSGRPINNEDTRVAAIDAARNVDYSFIVPPSTLGITNVLMSLRPNIYIEDEEHAREARIMKLGFLAILGVRHVAVPRSGVESSSDIIAYFGVEGAAMRSSLSFRFTENAAGLLTPAAPSNHTVE